MKITAGWYQKSLVAILGVAVIGSTFALTRQRDYAFFDPLVAIKAAVSDRYVDAPDENAMQLGAINGMIEALNDPYTEYVPPARTREFRKDLTGDFVGIGVQVVVRDGWLTVVSPMEDTPAFRAGVMADDRIVEIDGASTFGLTTEECVELLTGEPGKPVNITVERGGKSGQRLPIAIVRERIQARSVKGFHWDGGVDGAPGQWRYFVDPQRKIAYVRLTQFMPTSADEMRAALEAAGAWKGDVGGLVLDLRWNPGGLLKDAIAISDFFLKEGVIVSTRGRAHNEEIARAEPDGTLPDFPVVVLLNGQSASASEVLAGALVENDRAVVVGTRSFGKGLVQAVLGIPSTDGGQLKITEQRYYLPSGRSIQRTDDSAEWGVDPTPGFYVPLEDSELVELIRIRRQEEIIRAAGEDAADQNWSDPAWILEHLKDPQLAAAIKAVQGRIDTGVWTPTGLENAGGGAIALDELKRARTVRERMVRDIIRMDKRIATLESTAAPDDEASAIDFWDDAIDLTGGRLIVRDKDGKEIANLRITGNNLERWLIDADVRKQE